MLRQCGGGGEPVQNKTIINHYPHSLRDCQKLLTLSSWTGGRRPPTAQKGASGHKEHGPHPTDTLLVCLVGVRVNVTGGTTIALATLP